MAKESHFFCENFWKTIEAIDALREEVKLVNLLGKLKIKKSFFKEVQILLDDFGYELKLRQSEGEIYLSPPKEIFEQRNLGLFEYLHLQTGALQDLDQFTNENEKRNAKFLMILSTLEKRRRDESLFEHDNPNIKNKVEIVDEALLKNNILSLNLRNGKKKEILPSHLIYVEGVLNLVGEDCKKHCLVSYEIDELAQVSNVCRKNYTSHFSEGEIKEFISALRKMSEKEVRLILKLSPQEKFDLSPSHHFLGNPYITTNGDGELIWAATVEVTNELFDWLYSIRLAIKEFIDPKNVAEEFLNYCKWREKRVA